MKKILIIFTAIFIPFAGFAITATGPTGFDRGDPSAYVAPASFNVMYPYLTPEMRQKLYPGGTSIAPDPSGAWLTNAIGAGMTPTSAFAGSSGRRRISSRNQQNVQPGQAARAATQTLQAANAPAARKVVPRAATTNVARSGATLNVAYPASAPHASVTRRVVQRSGTGALHGNRTNVSTTNNARTSLTPTTASTVPQLPPDQCMALYVECMNQYCERPNASYNRCYCSPRLAQIDGNFKPRLEELARLITIAQAGGFQATDDDMEEFWQSIFFQYTGENSMESLNTALGSISWADAESRVRGQNAFVTGHSWCSQNLQGCYFMASNMRDAYRSEIARDCAKYEAALEQITNAAETMLQSFQQ